MNHSELSQAIITAVGSNVALSSVHDKVVAFCPAPQGGSSSYRPFVRLDSVGSNINSSFEHNYSDDLDIRFTVFADTLSIASTLGNALADEFSGGLILLGDDEIKFQRTSGISSAYVDKDVNDRVYKTTFVVKFRS